MKQTVNLHAFREAFRTMGRGEQFTYEGLEVLFDYLEGYEEDTGEDIELDVIALCCDYAEDAFENIRDQYNIDWGDAMEIEDQLEAVLDYLRDNTQVCGVTGDNTIVYQQF